MNIETFKHNGFTIGIEYDEDTETPRQPDEIGCQLVMSHKRYDWPNDAGINFDDFDGWAAIAEELSTNHGALVVANVYAYEHSGVAFKTGERTGQFADQWDSGVAGLAYVTAEDWKRTQIAAWSGSAEDIAQARKLIAGDVQLYGQWANGECYGYRITDEYGDEVAASWGFIGWDTVTEAAEEAADELQHVAKCNGTLNRETGDVEHTGPCPLHDQDDKADPNAPAPTIVVFRVWKGKNGGVIALFPYETGTVGKPETCSSFEHIGQHGAAYLADVISATRPATPEEYKPLKKELESKPYRYTLIRVDRTPRDAAAVRTAKLKASR